MWGKVMPLLLALSVALNVPFVAMWAHHTMRAPPCGSEGKFEGPLSCYKEIGASDDQLRVIEPRIADFQKSAHALFQDFARLHEELMDLIAAPETDREAIRAKQDEILEAHRKMGDLMLDNLLADKAILTPEQQKKMFDLIRQHCGHGRQGPMM